LNAGVTEPAADKHAHLRELLERSVRSGDAAVSPADRQLAFDAPDQLGGARGRYCAQVALDANGVTDADIDALHAEGLDDGRIFEYTVAAAVGQASRQLTAALAALDAAEGRGGA
jgi:alkylhydroperoxidase family enzyme